MGSQRATFAKRKREMELKDKARAKQERRAARRAAPRTSKGPEIAWDEAVNPTLNTDDELPPEGDAPLDEGDVPLPDGGVPLPATDAPTERPRGDEPTE